MNSRIAVRCCKWIYVNNIHNIAFPHQLECSSHLEGHVLEDDDGVLGGVFLEQGLEVGRAGGQDHLVRLAALPVRGDRHIRERLLIPENGRDIWNSCFKIFLNVNKRRYFF